MNFSSDLFGDESFRAYLCEDPVPNVALVGSTAAMRQHLSEGLRQHQSSSSGTQAKVRIQTFATVDLILCKKPARVSYEGHKAGSVLKRNWCHKHLQRVFGCVVLLLDWDAVKISDRGAFEQHVATFLDAARLHLRSNVNTRLLLVLTTSNPSSSDAPRSGSYVSSEEAQVSLRSKLGLDSKSLVVLYRDGADDYSVGRLSRMISEHVIKYHRDEIAKIKRMKGDATKSTNPQFLQARLRFKAGWHCLVLQDYKLLKHNLEKGYSILRFWSGDDDGSTSSGGAAYSQSQSLSSFDVRVAATIMVWVMVASNCNQLQAATSSKQELVQQMLEDTVLQYVKHLAWVGLPYPAAYLGSLDPDGLQIVQHLHHVYLGEWNHLLAKKIDAVLLAHHIVPKRKQLAVSPGTYYLAAARSWETVYMLVDRQQQFGGGRSRSVGGGSFIGNSSAPRPTADIAAAAAAAAKPSSSSAGLGTGEKLVCPPPAFLGVECRSSPVYYRLLMQRLSTGFVSNTIYELLQQSVRHCLGASIPRSLLRITYLSAEHFSRTADFPNCYEKLSHLLRSVRTQQQTGGPECFHDALHLAVHKLMVKACRHILRLASFSQQESTTAASLPSSETETTTTTSVAAGETAAPRGSEGPSDARSPPSLSTTTNDISAVASAAASSLVFDARYVAQVKEDLALSMVTLLGIPAVDTDGWDLICAELANNLSAGGVLSNCKRIALPSVGPYTHRSVSGTSFVRVMVFFHQPFAEVRKARSGALVSVRVETTSSKPLLCKACHLHLRLVPDASKPRAARLAHRSPFRISRDSPFVTTFPVPTPSADPGLLEVSHVSLDWRVGASSRRESVADVCVTVVQPFDNFLSGRIPAKFDFCCYDASALESPEPIMNYRYPTHRHRPVMRLVRPIAPISVEVLHHPQAIEGETFVVAIVLRNATATVTVCSGLQVFVAYIPTAVEIATIEGQDAGDVPEDAPQQRHTPAGYQLVSFTHPSPIPPGCAVTIRARIQCFKAGRFELPLRIRCASEGQFEGHEVAQLVSLHVCHPVFVTYLLSGTHYYRETRPLLVGDRKGLGLVPSGSCRFQFVESSVLRDAVTVADDDLSACRALGRFVKYDGSFARVDGMSLGAATGGALPLTSSLSPPLLPVVTLNNMLYSVERTQLPCGASSSATSSSSARGQSTNGGISPAEFLLDRPFLLQAKFSNSLQCPLQLDHVELRLSENIQLVSDDPAANVGHASSMPLHLGVDEDITVSYLLRPTRRLSQAPVGAIVLQLRHAHSSATEAATDDSSGAEQFAFELPLPLIDIVDASVTCHVEYPATVVAGEPFLATISVEVASAAPAAMEFILRQNSDSIVAFGRTRWTTLVQPYSTKKTYLKLVATTPGSASLPAMEFRFRHPGSESALSCSGAPSPDEQRLLFVLPATQALHVGTSQ